MLRGSARASDGAVTEEVVVLTLKQHGINGTYARNEEDSLLESNLSTRDSVLYWEVPSPQGIVSFIGRFH